MQSSGKNYFFIPGLALNQLEHELTFMEVIAKCKY